MPSPIPFPFSWLTAIFFFFSYTNIYTHKHNRKAVVESLTTLLLEVQRLSSPRTPSPSRSRSPSPSGRPSSPSLPRQQQYQQQQYQQQQYQQQQQQQQQQRGNILHSTTFSAGYVGWRNWDTYIDIYFQYFLISLFFIYFFF